MMSLHSLPPLRRRKREESELPAAEWGDGELAALKADEEPQPTFTPAQASETTPIPVIADAMRPTAAPDAEVLERVLRGLQNLGPSKGETFRTDFAELPLFRGTVRAAGWSGLHAGPPVPRFRRLSTDRWYDAQMARIGYATEVAQAGAHAALAQVAGNAAAGFRRAAGHGFRRAS